MRRCSNGQARPPSRSAATAGCLRTACFGLLIEGLLQSGIDVVDIGVVPTPLLYFSVMHWQMDGGAMITGSHNAAEYNGFKLGVGPSTIFGEEIQELRRIIERKDFPVAGARGTLSARAGAARLQRLHQAHTSR